MNPDGPRIVEASSRPREGLLQGTKDRLSIERAIQEAEAGGHLDWLVIEDKPEDLDLPSLRSLGFRLVSPCRDGQRWRLRRRLKVTVPSLPQAPATREALAGRTLCIVPYSHCDWAWTNSRAWHAQRYAAIHGRAIELLEEVPGFRWCADNFNELMDPIVALRPDCLPAMRRQIAEGRLDLMGGVLALVHAHRVGGETFIRNVILGQALFRNLFPEADFQVFALTDTLVGFSQMPQLLSLLRFKLYRACRPSEFLIAQGVPREFRWQGLDGTVMLCSMGHYGGWHDLDLAGCEGRWDAVAETAFQREIRPWSDHSFASVGWLPMGSDDILPLASGWREATAETPLPTFVDEWNRREPSALRFATPTEFAHLLEREEDRLPVLTGPLDIAGWTMWYGHIGTESLAFLRFQVERDLLETETLRALRPGIDAPDLNPIWEAMIRCSAHAMLWLFDEDYEERLELMRWARREARRCLNEARRALSTGTGIDPDEVIFFNPLPYPRREIVQVRKVFGLNQGNCGIDVLDHKGTLLLSQISDPLFYAEGRLQEAVVHAPVSIPPMGTVAVRIRGRHAPPDGSPQKASWDGRVLESEIWRLDLGPTGLERILRKDLGVSVERPGNPIYAHTDVWREPYFSSDPVQIFRWTDARIAIKDLGPLFARIEIAGPIGPHHARQEVLVDLLGGMIDFKTSLTVGHGANGEFKLSFLLPPQMTSLKADVPFGVEDRDVDRVLYAPVGADPVGCERMDDNVFFASTWVDAWDRDRGVAVFLEPGLQGFQHEPRDNALYAILHKAIVHPDRPWESLMTRRREGTGVHAFRACLFPHRGDWQAADLVRRSQGIWTPAFQLPTAEVVGSAGASLPPEGALDFGSPCIVLSALLPGPAPGAVSLRVYNASPAPVQTSATWRAGPVRKICKVDLQGVAIADPLPHTEGSFSLDLRAWEIATYCLQTRLEARGGCL